MAVLCSVIVLMVIVSAEMRRRWEYQDRIDYHMQNYLETPGAFFHQLPSEIQNHLVASAMYHAAMAERYKIALRVPLFFVGPAPPEPFPPHNQ